MYNYGEGVGGSSQHRQYQGYPYVNPMVIDVPTIDAATAARYTNLPRRPWVKETDKDIKEHEKENDNPVVYIDLPSSGQSSVSQPNPSSPMGANQSPSLDPDVDPVVYINLPESSGSDVAERRRTEDQESFVQNTIFYDPFKDRRIEVDQSDSDSNYSAGPSSSATTPNRPRPPNTLDLGSFSRGHGNPILPSSFSKEASVYGPLTPPNGYPEPPPAYTVEDPRSATVTEPATSPASNGGSGTVVTTDEPVRTQVIISPESNPDQKLLFCIFCGMRGHSLIIKQAGFGTHLVAVILTLLGLIPLLLVVYCTDFCKYKNHYCKNCNEKIAYEIPMFCKELSYRS